MPFVYRAPVSIVALAVTAAFAGCSGSGSAPSATAVDAFALGAPAWVHPAPPAHVMRHGWLSPAARTKPLIYVSDFSANTIEIYGQNATNPSPVGTITDGIDGPLGNFVDVKGTLYVANANNNTVTEYPAGSTSPSVTLSSGINHPISIAVDLSGDVAVGEFSSNEILEFPAAAHRRRSRSRS